MRRLWRRLGYLWNAIDPEGIELLSAALSLTFAILLFHQGDRANALAHAYAYGGLCLVSSLTKFAGVLWELLPLRIIGLGLGTVFWVALSGTFLLVVPGSITWLCFAVLALAQLWAIRRITRRP